MAVVLAAVGSFACESFDRSGPLDLGDACAKYSNCLEKHRGDCSACADEKSEYLTKFRAAPGTRAVRHYDYRGNPVWTTVAPTPCKHEDPRVEGSLRDAVVDYAIRRCLEAAHTQEPE